MVTLADGAAATSASSRDRAGQVMRQVAATGRQAIGEMHRTVTALRTDADEVARYPLPGLADLDDLLAKVRAAGLPVLFTIQGEARSLPPGTQLAGLTWKSAMTATLAAQTPVTGSPACGSAPSPTAGASPPGRAPGADGWYGHA